MPINKGIQRVTTYNLQPEMCYNNRYNIDMKDQDFKNLIKKEIEGVDISDCWIDPSKDYRRELNLFRVNKRGDLLIHRDRTKLNDGWEILIPRNRLTESDWISHMRQKAYMNFGEFVCAYLKALEMAGVKTLNIVIYGFDYACKYADEK